MTLSKIEWTEVTWNPITGCTQISDGCMNCYAKRMSLRLKAMGQKNYVNGFDVTCHQQMLDLPLHWKKPRIIFVNSMSDLFHEDVDENFIRSIFDIMGKAHWHKFQVLTKRSERLRILSSSLNWTDNIWMGVTIESAKYTNRLQDLIQSNAKHKFLSIEPMIGPIADLEIDNIEWVIVGGESGPGARVMEKEWVTEIRDQCISKNIPFFFKQWGGVNKKKKGRILDGRIWNESPFIQNV